MALSGSDKTDLDFTSVQKLLSDVLSNNDSGLVASDDGNGSSDESPPSVHGFTIHRFLGSGGGGEVWLGVRDGSDRLVAIKIFRHDFANERAMQRIRREIDVLERANLDCVPRILDHGHVDNRLYVVTEYIDGLPITKYCDEHGLDLKRRVELLAKVCDAVQKLHHIGIIHRDLKPSNILVSNSSGRGAGGNGTHYDASKSDATPHIIDFGIATFLDGDLQTTITNPNVPLGTPAYMSPEQARGERNKVTTQSDVYSLGALAYDVLLGCTPHDSVTTESSLELLHRVGFEQPRTPRDVDQKFPKPLAAVLHKAIESDQDSRYDSVSSLGDDFRRWLRREPVEAADMSLARRVAVVVTRHPLLTTTLLCMTVAIGTVLLTWLSVWYLNNQPWRLQFDLEKQSWARLLTRSGRTIHTWETNRTGICIATIIESNDLEDSPKAILIGYNRSAGGEQTARLCAYDFDNPDRLVWTSGAPKSAFDMPEPISQVKGGEFNLTNVILADVFPQVAGEEIVAIFAEPNYSVNVIRIFGQNRQLLYEVWHDGMIVGVHWYAHAGMLIGLGFNGEGDWSHRGVADVEGIAQPVALFALKPSFNQIEHEWLNPPHGDGTTSLVWYKCMLPRENMDAFFGDTIALGVSNAFGQNRDRYFDCRFQASDEKWISLVLNELGEIIFISLSEQVRNSSEPPDTDSFYFGQLPPLLTSPLDN